MSHPSNGAIAHAFDMWVGDAEQLRLARLSGFSRSQIFDWRCGRWPLPVYALAPTFRAVPDLSGLAHVMGLTQLKLQLVHQVGPVSSADDVRSAALHVAAHAGDVARVTFEALADGVLDAGERAELDAAAEQLERAAEELRQAARSPTVRAPRGCVRASTAAKRI